MGGGHLGEAHAYFFLVSCGSATAAEGEMKCHMTCLVKEAKRKCFSPVDLFAVIFPDVAHEKKIKRCVFTQQYYHV